MRRRRTDEPGPIKGDGSKENESTPNWGAFVLEAPPGIGPGMKVLQTSALPLGSGALFFCLKNGYGDRTRFIGADYGARTRHLHLGKVALYQMS